jgi:hypothetical protein
MPNIRQASWLWRPSGDPQVLGKIAPTVHDTLRESIIRSRHITLLNLTSELIPASWSELGIECTTQSFITSLSTPYTP